MKKKELKEIAQRMAEAEAIISNPDSTDYMIKQAKGTILSLTDRVEDMNDLVLLDELIQNFLEKSK